MTIETVEPIEEAAVNLRDWLAVGGFAPTVSGAQRVTLAEYAIPRNMSNRGLTFQSRRIVSEVLRLIRAAV